MDSRIIFERDRRFNRKNLNLDLPPVSLVNGEPFSPEEAEFFLESATEEELEMLEEGGYDLPEWED